MTSVLAMEGYVQKVLSMFLKRMQEHAGEVVYFALYTSMFAFDVVGELAYGEHLGMLEATKIKKGSLKQFSTYFISCQMSVISEVNQAGLAPHYPSEYRNCSSRAQYYSSRSGPLQKFNIGVVIPPIGGIC